MPDQATERYLGRLQKLRRQSESTPELSLREPLLELIRTLGADVGRRDLIVAPEARAGDIGQPDIYVKDGPRLIGFIETKAANAPLARLLKTSDQLRKYRASLPNWVLTDYYQFIFIVNGELGPAINIADSPKQLRDRFGQFFDNIPRNVRSASRLAEEMARRARLLRDGLLGALRGEAPGGPLRITLDFYRRHLMDDLTEAGFADTFAQTAVYGMFLGWLRWSEEQTAIGESSDGSASRRLAFTRRRAVSEIPPTVPFLRSSMRLLTSEEILPPPVSRLLDDLAALFDNTLAEPIMRQTSSAGFGHGNDPTLYFYERFLEKYDAGERQRRGVYYTPNELVSYVVRATQTLLRTEFSREDGLADPSVILLDPAVGTGTFLLGAATEALAAVEAQGTATQHRLIRNHILPDFYGFELLPAPYAVAHLKVGSFFDQRGYKLSKDEHAQIYLTNTLQKEEYAGNELELLPIFSAITDEALAARRIKHHVPVLVVLGNPPYERTSHNSNPISDRMQEDFYKVDGERITDRNTAPLKDDYLRFIRWAVWKLLEQDQASGGILAFVTNRAFIERTLHRGVRKFLLDRFDEMYVYDLHGDQREWFRDRVDEKVFKQVQAGIAVTIMVKRPKVREDQAKVYYREVWGTRENKLAEVAEATISDQQWSEIHPHKPLWLMVPYSVPAVYDSWPTVTQLFPVNVVGVQTHRDQLVVADTEEELRDRLRRFADLNIPDDEWEKLGIRTNQDWNLRQARAAVRADGPRNIQRWSYRGLERRWVAFDERLIDRTRGGVSPHLLGNTRNVALAFSNGSLPDGPYVLVSRGPVPAAVLSWRTFGAAYMAPLWLENPLSGSRDPNLAGGLLSHFGRSGITTTPEDLLHYVYAVLNSPWFRQTYADALRYGFARVPLTWDARLFRRLAEKGEQLARLHLFEHPDAQFWLPRMDGDDSTSLSAPVFVRETETMHLGETLTVSPVTKGMWDYQQGSYRALALYIQERQGRPLDSQEFDDFRHLAATIRLTIEQLPEIDALVAEASKSSFTLEELDLPANFGE